ncbi:MAG: hypothetical protein HY245_14400 [Rhizobiales bacterium]|nr:hypothetical protein [Hyphomicrobiales bacterium]
MVFQLGNRAHQIVAPAARRLGGERIVEMIGIGHPVAAFFDPHLGVEIVVLAHEFLDHAVDLGHLTALVFGLEAVQPKQRLA